jgi:hypothetical protein
MNGGRRSLHELELASGVRIVVVVDFDILGASTGLSGADASTGGADIRGAVMESKSDALEGAATSDPLDASPSDRSARGPLRGLHAAIPATSARSTRQGERCTGSD